MIASTVSRKSGARSWRAETFTATRGIETPFCCHSRTWLAGGVEHPFADRDDQAAFLRNGDEVRRQYQPMLRMLPADQRFHADDRTVLGAHLRLVEQTKFASFEALANVVFKNQARRRPRSQRSLIQLPVVTPLLLGVIHRGIRVL